MKARLFILIFLLSCTSFFKALSQSGPGGISNNTENVLWLRANDLSANNGDNITTWSDVSGNGLNATAPNGANEPVYTTGAINGFPSLSFDGTDYLSLGDALNFAPQTDSWSFFTVFNATSNSNRIILSRAESGSRQFVYETRNDANGNVLRTRTGGTIRNGINPIQGSWMLATALVNTTQINAWVGANQEITNQGIGSSTTTRDALVGARRHSSNADTRQRFLGDIAEIVFFNKEVNSAERIIIENYLSSKYNLTTVSDQYAGDTGGNGDMDYEVVGIGRVDGSNIYATTTGSGGGIFLAENTGLSDNEWVFAGHDNTAHATTSNDVVGIKRWAREWYLDKTGNLDLDIAFSPDDAGFGIPANISPYKLLYRANTGVDFAEVTTSSAAIDGNNRVVFTVADANLASGYYTLGISSETWYSYQSGNWNDATTWTLDGGVIPLYTNPGSSVPSAGDDIVITSGHTVTIQSTNNNLSMNDVEVVGELDITSSSGHTFTTMSGTGRMLLAGDGTVDNFPSGDASLFADASAGGTLVVEGTGVEFDQARSFNNLIVDMTGLTDEMMLTANLTVNGDLTVSQGVLKINDNASTTVLDITINQNVTVSANGQIAVGTGNTINGAYDIVTSEGTSTLPATGDYNGIYHQFTIGGDFTNSGTVRFTNLTNPDYDDFTTTGAANVTFTGNQSNTATLLGQTDFYNLIVNKGSDQSYILEINSSATTNFELFGPSVLVHFPNVFNPADAAGFTTQNPEVRKALWIRNGTLKLTGKVHIPTLAEGVGFGFEYYNDFIIPENGALWLDGAEVEVYATARTATPEVAGHSGVGDNYWGQGLAVFGKLRVSDGVLDTRNSWEALVFYPGTSAPEIIIEGGSVTAGWLRDQFTSGLASYTQSGGTVNITGNPSSGAGARFGLSDSDMSFNMSGGQIIMGGGSEEITFLVKSADGNYNVTGGEVVFNMVTTGNTIDVNANLWDVEINSTAGSQTITLVDDLAISNDLDITANATFDVDNANDFNVSIGADLDVAASGTYLHQSNTTTIDGSKETNITLGALQTFNNLTINKSNSDEKVNIVTALSTAIQVDGAFRLENGFLEYNTFDLDMNGSVYVADTIGSDATTGSLLLSGSSTQDMTSTSGVIRNLELNNSNGSSLTGDLVINNTLTLTDGVFDINTSKLTMAGSTANIAGTFGVGEMIQTAGNASDGGLEMYVDANETITFPIGTDANVDTRYTPLVAVYSSFDDDGYISVSPADEVLATTDGSGGTMLSYYWHVEHSDFTVLPKITSYTFSGSENDDGTGSAASYSNSWRAGKVLADSPFTRSREDNTSINNPTGHDIDFDGDGTPFDVENADYSAGPSNRFNGAPGVYYSKEDPDDGDLNFLPNWNSTGSWVRSDQLIDANGDTFIDEKDWHDGRQPDSPAAPGAGDIAIVGFIPWTDTNITYRGAPHHLNLNNVTEQCAQLVFTKMTDASGDPVVRNNDRFWAMRPSILIGGASGQLNANIVRGEGEFFIRFGGDQDFSAMDLGDFVSKDSSIFFYEAAGNRTYNNAPDLMSNLILGTSSWGANDFDIQFTNTFQTNVNLEILGDANLVLNNGVTGDIIIGNDLIMYEDVGGVVIPGCCTSGASGGGAEVRFPNSGVARTVTVGGDLIMENAGGLISVSSPGTTPMNHIMNISGDITQNTAAGGDDGLLFWTAANEDNITLNLLGDANMTYTKTSGDVPELHRLILNKGTDQSVTATISTDFNLNGTTNTATKALELQNGTLILNEAGIDINLSTGGGDFSIPGTAALQVTLGEVNVSGDDTGISLDGSLIIDGGTVDLDDGVNNGNNYIEYSTSGNATLNMSSGFLTVGSQIRRSTNTLSGVLQYTQTGGTLVVGKNAAPEADRGVFEVLNTGSSFTHTAGSFTVVRQNSTSPEVAALNLNPTTSDLTGSTITIGNTDTPASQNDIGIKSSIALNNLVINGSNNPTVDLEVFALTINGDLTIGASNTLDGNAIDLTLTGEFSNAGSYLGNGNTTYFNAPTSQHYSGAGTESFYSLTKTGAGTLDIDKDITITNVLDLDQGTFDSNAQAITLEGNMIHDATHTSTSGNGIVFAGSSQQDLERSSAGTSSFGIVTINNGNGVRIPDGNGYNFDIDGGLRLEVGVFNIGGSLIKLSTTADITEVNTFSVSNMIQTNSSFTDNGLQKDFPTIAAPATFVYPIGQSKYTPVALAITSMDTGSITVRPANEIHPGIVEDVESPDTEITDVDNALSYHWILVSSNIASMTADATFTYDAGDLLVDAPYSSINYIPARLFSASSTWDKAFNTADFDENNNQFTISMTTAADAQITGEYTAGVGVDNANTAINGAIPDVVPEYESNSAGGGDYHTQASWSTTIPSGGPIGGIVTIKSGDVVSLVNNSVRLLRTVIESGGILEVDNSTFHRLGDVSGAGTLRITSDGTNANLPAGAYTSFFDCATGGTLEYAGLGSYNMLSGITQLRGLSVAGSGTRTLSNNDIIVCEDLTLTGPTFNNTFNRNITVQGDMNLTSGTFNSGLTNIVDVDGTLNITGGTYNGQASGDDVVGAFNMTSGGFDLDNSILTIEGDMTYVSGSFDSGTGSSSIILAGSSPQTVTGNLSFNRLEINNTSGATLQNTVDISNELELTNGILTASGTMTMAASAIATPATGSATSFVDGKLNKTMNVSSSFVFPIGKGTRWGYASVNNVSSGGLTWEAEYFNASPTNQATVDNITPTDAVTIKTVSDGEYWVISDGNVAASGVTANIGLSWDGSSDVSANQAERETLEVMVWNDAISTWDNFGGGDYSSGHSQTDGTFTSNSTVSFSEKTFTLGSGNANNELPITLESFSGYAENGIHYLDWITSSEINNDYFELQRSLDGLNYEVMATVEGAGTTTDRQSYSYTDKRPVFGKNYYRLVQVDIDGTRYDEGGILLLENSNQFEELDYKLFPNPTSRSNINLEISSPDGDREAIVSLYDLQGRRYYHGEITPDQLFQPISIKVGNEAKSGMYIVIIEQGDYVVQKKLLLQ